MIEVVSRRNYYVFAMRWWVKMSRCGSNFQETESLRTLTSNTMKFEGGGMQKAIKQEMCVCVCFYKMKPQHISEFEFSNPLRSISLESWVGLARQESECSDAQLFHVMELTVRGWRQSVMVIYIFSSLATRVGERGILLFLHLFFFSSLSLAMADRSITK